MVLDTTVFELLQSDEFQMFDLENEGYGRLLYFNGYMSLVDFQKHTEKYACKCSLYGTIVKAVHFCCLTLKIEVTVIDNSARIRQSNELR